MFSNSTNDAQSNLPKPPVSLARTGSHSASSARSDALRAEPAAPSGTSVIGSDLTILGEKITIISENRLQVDGQVRGDVHGKQVVISKDGSVTGKVCAEKIEVRGGVSGSIRALSVTLHESARVDGDIMHQKLSISEGAEFDGRVRLIKDGNELMPNLNADVIASRMETDDVNAGRMETDNVEAGHFGALSDEVSHE